MARRVSVQLTMKSAKLSEDFGLEWATKLFGAEAIASLPKFECGPNKGKPKGFVIWRNALQGGWCRETSTPVKQGGLVDAWIGNGFFSQRSDAVSGQWLGRFQPLGCSAGYYLFEQGRQRHADDEARAARERAEMIAEMKATT